MLILSRRQNEIICIGGMDIQIMVVEIRGDHVRLGITAPRDVTVHRLEIQRLQNNSTNEGESTDD